MSQTSVFTVLNIRKQQLIFMSAFVNKFRFFIKQSAVPLFRYLTFVSHKLSKSVTKKWYSDQFSSFVFDSITP